MKNLHENHWNESLAAYQCHICGYPTADGHWHPHHQCPLEEEEEPLEDWLYEEENYAL